MKIVKWSLNRRTRRRWLYNYFYNKVRASVLSRGRKVWASRFVLRLQKELKKKRVRVKYRYQRGVSTYELLVRGFSKMSPFLETKKISKGGKGQAVPVPLKFKAKVKRAIRLTIKLLKGRGQGVDLKKLTKMLKFRYFRSRNPELQQRVSRIKYMKKFRDNYIEQKRLLKSQLRQKVLTFLKMWKSKKILYSFFKKKYRIHEMGYKRKKVFKRWFFKKQLYLFKKEYLNIFKRLRKLKKKHFIYRGKVGGYRFLKREYRYALKKAHLVSKYFK